MLQLGRFQNKTVHHALPEYFLPTEAEYLLLVHLMEGLFDRCRFQMLLWSLP